MCMHRYYVHDYTHSQAAVIAHVQVHSSSFWLYVVHHFLRVLAHRLLAFANFPLPLLPLSCITDVPAPLIQSSAASQPCL